MSDNPIQQDVYIYNRRPEVAKLIPASAKSALDVGCAVGGFGETLRMALGPEARIVGIDPVESAVAAALSKGQFSEVVRGYFPDDLPNDSSPFDLVCFNDILEHTVDPWEILEHTRQHLSPTGQILASIPNVQYAPVLWGLLRGDFEYTESGVMDRTHLRFFTRRSMINMFERSGYRVTSCEGINNVIYDIPTLGAGHRRKLRHILGPAQWMQYALVAEPR